MASKAPPIVRASDGRIGTIIERDGGGGDDGMVDVLFEDGERRSVPVGLLVAEADGGYRLDLARVEASGGAAVVVVPVVAEEVSVGKRWVETGTVRVHKTVRTTERVVDEPLTREEVVIERVAINREIDEAVSSRQEGDTLIVPLLEEILVVRKQLILREEVRITRRKVEYRAPETVSLRVEEATVERSRTETGADSR